MGMSKPAGSVDVGLGLSGPNPMTSSIQKSITSAAMVDSDSEPFTEDDFSKKLVVYMPSVSYLYVFWEAMSNDAWDLQKGLRSVDLADPSGQKQSQSNLKFSRNLAFVSHPPKPLGICKLWETRSKSFSVTSVVRFLVKENCLNRKFW